MKTAFRTSFIRDLKKIKTSAILDRVSKTISADENADSIEDIPNCKKLSGSRDALRIRIGDHRIGAIIDGATFEFVRCLNRRDLYRYFP